MQKESLNIHENFNLLPYVEWDRFVTLTGAQAAIYGCECQIWKTYYDVLLLVNTTIDPNKDISKTRQVHVK
jgi:hypothetical protein